MKSKSTTLNRLFSCAVVLLSIGCSGSKIDIAPDIAMLEQSTERIIVAFKSKNPEAAHGSLHEVGFLLKQINQKAKSLSLSQEKLEEISQQAEILRTEFEILDGFLHGEEMPEDYDISPVADKLRESVFQLQESIGINPS